MGSLKPSSANMDCAERDLGRTSSLLSILSRHPIYDGIYSRLSPGARIRFGRTCLLAYKSVQDFHSRAFNINRHLRRFFNDPIAFRNMQARLAILISGSNALQFLDSTFYSESDLDLYVSCDSAKEVGHWLMEHEGYSSAPSKQMEHEGYPSAPSNWQADEYAFASIFGFDDFTKDGPDGPLTVQVVATVISPLEAILNFHSTCVMNCIAFDAAYSLYPQATFEQRLSLGIASRNDRTAQFTKYRNRGWQLILITPPQEKKARGAPFHGDVIRWVHDRHSWVVPLDTSDLQPRPRLSPTSEYFSWDPVIYNSWKLVERLAPGIMGSFHMTPGAAIGHRGYGSVMGYEYLVFDSGLFQTVTSFLKQQMHERSEAERSSSVKQKELSTWCDAAIGRLIDAHRAKEIQK